MSICTHKSDFYQTHVFYLDDVSNFPGCFCSGSLGSILLGLLGIWTESHWSHMPHQNLAKSPCRIIRLNPVGLQSFNDSPATVGHLHLTCFLLVLQRTRLWCFQLCFAVVHLGTIRNSVLQHIQKASKLSRTKQTKQSRTSVLRHPDVFWLVPLRQYSAPLLFQASYIAARQATVGKWKFGRPKKILLPTQLAQVERSVGAWYWMHKLGLY